MFSSWRHVIMQDGHEQSDSLSVEDRLRFDLVFSEFVWAYWQLWDRARVGVVDRKRGAVAAKIVASKIRSSAVTSEWWETNKETLGRDFYESVERALG